MNAGVGFIIYALDRNPRGIGQYTIRLLEALNLAGCVPAILQSGGWPKGFRPINNLVLPLPGSRFLPSLLTLGQLEIGWQTRHKALNLVHDPTGTIPLGFCGAKRVTTICDTIPCLYPEVSTTLERLIYHYWLPQAVKRMDCVITISQHSKSDLEKHLKIPGSKVTVTQLAADSKFHVLADNEIAPALVQAGIECPYILYVGTVEPRKNLLRLLEAYQLLLKWSKRWRLVIVGARNYWKSSLVAKKVEQLGLQDQVKFIGYTPDIELAVLYNGADLFCFPSLYEGFGLPVLEAMACGIPVVTSNNSSLPEVTGEAAILIDPYNIDEIASAMKRVLEDPELAHDMRLRGLERAAQFTWERTARETIAVYEKVLGESLL